MMSKNQIKLIRSLSQKKFRLKHGLFKAEGVKVIQEMIKADWPPQKIFTTVDVFAITETEVEMITEAELKKISSLKSPQTAVALFAMPEEAEPSREGLSLVLDGVRDPGNLGTIIRLCDWFGVSNLICSKDTADVFNPKVIQSTMGSLARVLPIYLDLKTYFKTETRPVFGAEMKGENVHRMTLPEHAVLVLGNESHGIRKEVEGYLTHSIAIPQFGHIQSTESLNVATAGAVLLNEFKR